MTYDKQYDDVKGKWSATNVTGAGDGTPRQRREDRGHGGRGGGGFGGGGFGGGDGSDQGGNWR